MSDKENQKDDNKEEPSEGIEEKAAKPDDGDLTDELVSTETFIPDEPVIAETVIADETGNDDQDKDGPSVDDLAQDDDDDDSDEPKTDVTIISSSSESSGAPHSSTVDDSALEPMYSSDEEDEDGTQGAMNAKTSTLTLEDIGLTAGDLPIFDPETGSIHINSSTLGPGKLFYLYNTDGKPLFGYVIDEEGFSVTVEEGANSLHGAPPAEEKEHADTEDDAKPTVPVELQAPTEADEDAVEADKDDQEEKEPTKPVDGSVSARRARAASLAGRGRASRKGRTTGRAAAQPQKTGIGMKFIAMSTVMCILVLIGWGLWYTLIRGTSDDTDESKISGASMTFTPIPFSPEDLDVSEPPEETLKRFKEAGWQISKPQHDTKWGMRESGIIDSGEVNRPGSSHRTREGNKAFQFTVETGFLSLAGAKPDRQGNLTVMLNVPSLASKVNFGYGKELADAFLVVESKSPKEIRRHKMQIEYNTWYQLKAKADNGYVNFYFNGQKLDSVELDHRKIKHIAFTTYRARALFRNFNLLEEGVKPKPKPKPEAPEPEE